MISVLTYGLRFRSFGQETRIVGHDFNEDRMLDKS